MSEFMTVDKARCLGILGDELHQMMEIGPDLKRRILVSASKAMDIASLPGLAEEKEPIIVDKDLSGYMTKAEIMEALDKVGVVYTKAMLRTELLDLLEAV